MTHVERQEELSLTRRPSPIPVAVEMIRSKRTAGQAFTLACDASGLVDKEICSALKMDKATFSRIKAGDNTLNADLVSKFCEVVGNNIYPEWIAYQVGCGLVLLKSELERRLEERERELAREREKVEFMTTLLQGGKS